MDKVIAKARKQGIWVKTFDGIVFFPPEELMFGVKRKVILLEYKGKKYFINYYLYNLVWALAKENLMPKS